MTTDRVEYTYASRPLTQQQNHTDIQTHIRPLSVQLQTSTIRHVTK